MRILHIDMDAFFASVEELRRPEFIGKPVVIGGNGDPIKRGVVSTASYEARKFGVHSAMPLRTAHKLCPDAVFLPVDYEEYSRMSEKIKDILREFTTIIEEAGIDEAFLDISEIDTSSEEIAKEIKKRIKDETRLTCSIGIAPNKLLAKIASDMQKPNGLTVITKGDIESRIWPLPVRKIWGVGPKTEACLKDMGIRTIGELASLPLDKLTERFGESSGDYLYNASRGVDESPLITHREPKSSGRETTFEKDVDDLQVITETLAELTSEVVDDIKEEGYKCRTVTVKVRFSDFETHTKAKTLYKPTDSLKKLRKTAFECLKGFEFKKKVRLIGVRVSKLEKVGNGN
ncbi:MAG: DNA polymerase IV [Candidatus Scalindua rubra]|uniref:DNA polymerase IV n=1 Tax=Candidatus Scalindua rubra TaxID=1872076 RepID=A0A1E3XF88_9BACT|nr:MAG: DNA polymerase IV [Candidatus Scalindua rubra]